MGVDKCDRIGEECPYKYKTDASESGRQKEVRKKCETIAGGSIDRRTEMNLLPKLQFYFGGLQCWSSWEHRDSERVCQRLRSNCEWYIGGQEGESGVGRARLVWIGSSSQAVEGWWN